MDDSCFFHNGRMFLMNARLLLQLEHALSVYGNMHDGTARPNCRTRADIPGDKWTR